MLHLLAGFTTFPFHFHGTVNAQGYHGKEDIADIGSHSHFRHSIEPQGITVGGQELFWRLGKPPEKGGSLDRLNFRTRLRMGHNTVGITAAEEEER